MSTRIFLNRSLCAIALGLLLAGCGTHSNADASSGSTATLVSPASAVSAPSPASSSVPSQQWVYGITAGDAFNKAQSYASLDSTNVLNFQFPYEGPQHANLTVMGGTVILSIEKGQFDCDVDGCLILAKFDGSQVQDFTATLPTDGSDSTIFINESTKFIKELAHAKMLNLDTSFYQEGEQELDFNLSGFDIQKVLPKRNSVTTKSSTETETEN